MRQLSLVQKQATISILVALVVHALALASWVSVILLDRSLPNRPSTEQEGEPEKELKVMIQTIVMDPPKKKPFSPAPKIKVPAPNIRVTPPKPSIGVRPLKPKRTQAQEAKRRFARTSADQAGKPDAPTSLLGDRDTRAAAELAPAPRAAANTPSQDGVNPLHPKQVETVNRDYLDGSVGADQTGPETDSPQEATASRDTSKLDEMSQSSALKPKSGTSVKPTNKHLQQGPKLAITDKGETMIENQNKVKEAPKERAQKEGRGEAIKQKPKKGGFQGLARKNKMTGSITRRGKSALNVKNSPLGRYQTLVSKSVELEWRRKCAEQRDHIVPGVVSVRFYIDTKGHISGIKFQEVIGASYIMTGFTQRAIRKAKLPNMSPAVIKELNGEPLELIYSFYF